MSNPNDYPDPYAEDVDEQEAQRYTEEVVEQLKEIDLDDDKDTDIEDLRG